ncbi:MAG: hypothetical protein QOD53_458, partial [Thermoleophilaceae bacterium]|nr:hypothetical protein [Thermoleophilaceae bacterium]
VLALEDQTILQRFFFFPAALLAAFAGMAALGWTARAGDDPGWRVWRAGGLALALALVAGIPSDVDRILDSRAGLRADERLQSGLRTLAGDPRARRTLHACRPVFVPAGGTIPMLALFSDTRPAAFAAGPRPAPGGALVLTAPGLRIADLPYPLPAPAAVPPGYRAVARDRSWTVLRGCPG